MGLYYKIKNVGVWNAIKIAFFKYLDINILKLHYLVLKTDIKEVDKALDGFDLKVKELRYEDFLKGNPENFDAFKLEIIKERLKSTDYKSWGIIENDVLIYSTWISTGHIGLPYGKINAPLLPNEGLLEDSYCDPIARGRGLHGKMNLYRIKQLYEMDRARVVVIVYDKNEPALKVQRKCGFEDYGTFISGKILGIPFNTFNKKKYDNR